MSSENINFYHRNAVVETLVEMLIHQTLKIPPAILWIPAVEAFRFHTGAKWWHTRGRLVGTPGIR
jgi:hypothetical protein